jgi:hypothetical protein
VYTTVSKASDHFDAQTRTMSSGDESSASSSNDEEFLTEHPDFPRCPNEIHCSQCVPNRMKIYVGEIPSSDFLECCQGVFGDEKKSYGISCIGFDRRISKLAAFCRDKKKLNNANRRFLMYRALYHHFASRAAPSEMCRVRVRIHTCVVFRIKIIFPNPDGTYIGFVDK